MSHSADPGNRQLQYCGVCRQLIRPGQFQSQEALIQNGTAFHAGCLAASLGAVGSGMSSGVIGRRQSGPVANLSAPEPDKAQVHSITAGLARPASAVGGHGGHTGHGGGGKHGLEAGRSGSTGKHAVVAGHAETGRATRRSGALARVHGSGRSKSGAGLAMAAGAALVAIGIGVFFLLTRGDTTSRPEGAAAAGASETGGSVAKKTNEPAPTGAAVQQPTQRGTLNPPGTGTSGTDPQKPATPETGGGKSTGDPEVTPPDGSAGNGTTETAGDQGLSPYEIARRYKLAHPDATPAADPSSAPPNPGGQTTTAPGGQSEPTMTLPLSIAADAIDQPAGHWQRGEVASENGKSYIAWKLATEHKLTLDFSFDKLTVHKLPPTLHLHVEYRIICSNPCTNLMIKVWNPGGMTSQNFVDTPPVGRWVTADLTFTGCSGDIDQMELHIPDSSGENAELDIGSMTISAGP